jgi:hypothetical protein
LVELKTFRDAIELLPIALLRQLLASLLANYVVGPVLVSSPETLLKFTLRSLCTPQRASEIVD